jgi:hypothetical protein
VHAPPSGHAAKNHISALVSKAEFFLFTGGFCQDPLPEGGYFTQFCLTVMTNQIKSVFTD